MRSGSKSEPSGRGREKIEIHQTVGNVRGLALAPLGERVSRCAGTGEGVLRKSSRLAVSTTLRRLWLISSNRTGAIRQVSLGWSSPWGYCGWRRKPERPRSRPVPWRLKSLLEELESAGNRVQLIGVLLKDRKWDMVGLLVDEALSACRSALARWVDHSGGIVAG